MSCRKWVFSCRTRASVLGVSSKARDDWAINACFVPKFWKWSSLRGYASLRFSIPIIFCKCRQGDETSALTMLILIDFVENFSWGCFFAGDLPTPSVYSTFGNLYVFRSSHVSWRCFQTESDWRSVMAKLRQLMCQELLAEKHLHPSHNSASPCD